MRETIAKLVKPGLRMKDVAARAGVSVMTVSRALSHPDKVSGETLRRVQSAVDAVLYVPNGLAGNLSSRKSKAVGVIVPGINNSLYSSMIEAVSSTLRARGYHLMIADSGLNLENEEKAITSFLAQRVCGLILHNTQHTRKARSLISSIGVPTVEVGNLVERPIDLCVSYSNFDAAKAMTIHLGRLGYRRMAFVSLALGNNDRARKRRDGFLTGIRELGLAEDFMPDHRGRVRSSRRCRCDQAHREDGFVDRSCFLFGGRHGGRSPIGMSASWLDRPIQVCDSEL